MLRSMKELENYTIIATDGPVGHVNAGGTSYRSNSRFTLLF